MFEDALESEGPSQSSIFPFLSVLFCAIGALMVMMIMGSMRTTLKNTGIMAKIEDRKQRSVVLAHIRKEAEKAKSYLAQVSLARAGISSARERIARGSAKTKEVSARLSDLRPKGRQARTRTAKVGLVRKRSKAQIARRDLVAGKQATAGQVAEAQARVKGLETTSADLTAKRDNLRRRAESPEARFRTVDGDSGRKPVYLELHSGANGDTLLVHSPGTSVEPGTKIPVAQALARGGYLVDLGKQLARSGSARYVMLLVRPGTIESFHAATDRLTRLRAPFAHEPVDEGWSLKFE
ncbi:MAG: hypothetical protein ACYSU0_02895 [Planctomycetota bacterium]|jgi:uncharacterized protein YlxW (UPF0749 family)